MPGASNVMEINVIMENVTEMDVIKKRTDF